MPRRIVDARGIEWEVWEVSGRRTLADMPAPWAAEGSDPGASLLFESDTERRHLAGCPSAWEWLTAEQLVRLCESAVREPAPHRLARFSGVARAG